MKRRQRNVSRRTRNRALQGFGVGRKGSASRRFQTLDGIHGGSAPRCLQHVRDFGIGIGLERRDHRRDRCFGKFAQRLNGGNPDGKSTNPIECDLDDAVERFYALGHA